MLRDCEIVAKITIQYDLNKQIQSHNQENCKLWSKQAQDSDYTYNEHTMTMHCTEYENTIRMK